MRNSDGNSGDRLYDSAPGALPPADLEVTVQLLSAAKRGDEQAARELLARYHERLSRIVRIRLGRPLRRYLETQDIVQETYRAALQGLAGLDLGTDPDLLAWLVRVAVNRIRDEADRLHAQRRDVAREVGLPGESDYPGAAPAPVDSPRSPSSEAALNELRELLDAAVAELADDHREVVLMRDYAGAPWERIAAELRRGVHASQQLHQRAWIHLRRQLGPRLRDLRDTGA